MLAFQSAKSAAPTAQKAAPAAGLAFAGIDLFRELIAVPLVIDSGIVRGSNKRNHRRNRGNGPFGGAVDERDILARTE